MGLIENLKSYSEGIQVSADKQEVLTSFLTKGFPTTKDEEWKYTSLKKIIANEYTIENTGAVVDASTIEKIFTQLDKTDFAVIRLILHRQYLTNLCNAFSSAITTRSNNKDYYFAFKAKPFNLEKTYTGFQLISLQKAFENKRISNNLQYYYIIENNNKKIIKLDYIDQLLIIYFI